ncbi:MAG: XRE family transcriptional regulator [Kiritimatiellae bacterium]|nr:XRE family transcriptional regulator [Kiritimatiellia bacterium]
MVLRHRDRELLRFEWVEPQGVRVVSVNEAERRFLPLEMHGVANDETLWTWLTRRTVPRNRRNIEELMARIGLSSRNVKGIIELCRGLSLNDVYWVVPDGCADAWKDFNLYENDFPDAIAQMAFSGVGPDFREQWTSSPEFTTNGMLAKCWRRIDGNVLLYKAGTEGASNTGFEPYSEFYAAQIAKAMGLDHVAYGLSRFKGRLCSTCPLFTSDKYGYVPAGRVVSRDEALADPRFADVFFFDAVIFNTDRHMGNFGYLVDNDTNEIVGAAPIFDNGYGLFSLALDRKGDSHDEFCDLRRFVSRVNPALYVKWLGFPGGLTKKMKERLDGLRGFRIKRHPRYNLPVRRIEAIEDFTQKRIREICEYGVKADDFLAIQEGECTVNRADGSVQCTHTSDSLSEQIKQNMRADPFITKMELADLLQISPRWVARKMKDLQASGEIRRIGADKNGHWEVVER